MGILPMFMMIKTKNLKKLQRIKQSLENQK